MYQLRSSLKGIDSNYGVAVDYTLKYNDGPISSVVKRVWFWHNIQYMLVDHLRVVTHRLFRPEVHRISFTTCLLNFLSHKNSLKTTPRDQLFYNGSVFFWLNGSSTSQLYRKSFYMTTSSIGPDILVARWYGLALPTSYSWNSSKDYLYSCFHFEGIFRKARVFFYRFSGCVKELLQNATFPIQKLNVGHTQVLLSFNKFLFCYRRRWKTKQKRPGKTKGEK